MMESNFVEANGIRIHYHRTGGDKPQVLLLHGITDSGACWTPVMEQLQADYDCIALDARGHGLTDAPATGYAPNDHAADVAAVITTLKLNRPALLGHSMGGAVATLVAAQHPALVRSAIFEDPAWLGGGMLAAPAAREQMHANWLADFRANKAKTRDTLIAEARAQNPRWSMGEIAPWAAAHEQVHEEVLQWLLAPQVDSRAALQQMQCPALLITGDAAKGVVISPAQAAEAQTLNARLQVVNIAGTGHCIRRDDFAPFMQAVRAFLAQVS